MPIMIGQTKDEGALFSSKFITDPNCLQYLDKYFDALSSILLFNKTGNFGEEGNVSKILKVGYVLYETVAFFLESEDVGKLAEYPHQKRIELRSVTQLIAFEKLPRNSNILVGILFKS